ncbi:MAG: hypothetical protein OXG24_03930 [Gammaproteobacteria bacterium]|nr:hypothetical protein [Gammaproteobacteria bacterium]
MRRLLATTLVVIGTSTTAQQDHFVLGSLGYSSISFNEIRGSAEVYTGGFGYYGFFENGLHLGVHVGYDYGEGLDCSFFPCQDAILEKTDIGLDLGFKIGQFTPFVSVYSSNPVWDTTEILRSFGFEREEEVKDYGIGTWVGGGDVMPNLWFRFSADGFEKDKGLERTITGMGIYRLTRNLMVGGKFSLFIADEDHGSKTAFMLGWRF